MEPQFDEIWVESPDGQFLRALIHGDRGWLMYLRAYLAEILSAE